MNSGIFYLLDQSIKSRDPLRDTTPRPFYPVYAGMSDDDWIIARDAFMNEIFKD
jgi:hypothetical protein